MYGTSGWLLRPESVSGVPAPKAGACRHALLQNVIARSLATSATVARQTVGGTAKQNAAIIEDILNNVEQGPKRDMVALNASAGFVVAGIATDIRNGLEIAREILSEGGAAKVLKAWQEFC